MRVLIVLALIGAAVAAPNEIHRIVGGENATIEEYNFIVAMMYDFWGTNHRQSCGGTLITINAIVSGAHCYVGDTVNQWRVRAGSSYASSGGTVLEVSRLILHAEYNATLLTNDIAMVRLASMVTLSTTIGVARIAGPNYQLPDDTLINTAGWGRLMPGGMTSEVLQHVDVNVINHALCTERYAYLKTQPSFENWPDVTPEMLCLGILDVGGKDACAGDSGGPAVHQRDVLFGITSWGYSCAHYYYPGVYVRVSSYTSWITENAIA